MRSGLSAACASRSGRLGRRHEHPGRTSTDARGARKADRERPPEIASAVTFSVLPIGLLDGLAVAPVLSLGCACCPQGRCRAVPHLGELMRSGRQRRPRQTGPLRGSAPASGAQSSASAGVILLASEASVGHRLALRAQVDPGTDATLAAAQSVRPPALGPTAPTFCAPAACCWARITLPATWCRVQSRSPSASACRCSSARSVTVSRAIPLGHSSLETDPSPGGLADRQRSVRWQVRPTQP
jgi:hypothetical protein